MLTHHFNWKRLSMAGALGFAPDASSAFLFYGMRAGSYNDEALIEFLEALHTELVGGKVTIVWDRLASHRSKAMTAWVKSQRSWVRTELLPPYGHDLNPIELVWGNVKSSELANYCADTIAEAAEVADAGLGPIGGDRARCSAFLRHTGLSL